ncbi:Uncharacterized protein YeaC [Durusdinium trenchii]
MVAVACVFVQTALYTRQSTIAPGWVLLIASVAVAVVFGYCFQGCSGNRKVLPGLVTSGLAALPLLWNIAIERIGFGSDPYEVQLAYILRNLMLALASRWNDPRALRWATATSLFLVLFGFMWSINLWTAGLLVVYATLGIWWLVDSHWKVIDVQSAASTKSAIPFRPALFALSLVAVFVIATSPVGGKLDATSALNGFFPSSGGTRYHDARAVGGVGDGDQMVAAKEQASSFGPIDSELFLESKMPSLYDIANEFSEGVPLKAKRPRRAIPLAITQVQQNHQRRGTTDKPTREFQTIRQRTKSRVISKDLKSHALLLVRGPTPQHLGLEVYDHWDGQSLISKGPTDPLKVRLDPPDQGRGRWLRLLSELPGRLFTQSILTQVRIVNLRTERVPTPANTTAVTIDGLHAASIFTFADDGSLAMNVDFIPQLAILNFESSLRDRSIAPELQRGAGSQGNPKVVALAEAWTIGSQRGWPQVEAIIQRLRSEYTHDPLAEVPEDTTDAVEHFLLESKRGPDYLFAASAAVMLSGLGYETRVISGLYVNPKNYERLTDLTAVFKEDLHFWLEVRSSEGREFTENGEIDGGSWITLEPTPGYELQYAPETFWAWVVRQSGNAYQAMIAHPIATLLWMVTCGLVVYLRLAIGELVLLGWWCLSHFVGDVGYLGRSTLLLIERRARLRKCPRPQGVPFVRWEVLAGQDDFLQLAAWSLYGDGLAAPCSVKEARTACARSVDRLRASLNGALRGKPDVAEMVLACLLARGHLLLEDLPGLGKTTLAKALALAVGGTFARVQCTPDLMPSDITGFSMFNQKTREFEFNEGPVFSDVLLADEINRTTPRTQSALFEAMAERQVTIDRVHRPLPSTFFVIATQNPIESHGAYPLPEAQLDRFAAKLSIGYPDRESELELLEADSKGQLGTDEVKPVLDPASLCRLQQRVMQTVVGEKVRRYLVDLAQATRTDSEIDVGLSPRGLITWQRVAQSRAFLRGRDFVSPEDVQDVATPVLGVRLLGNFSSSDEIVSRLLEEMPAAVDSIQTINVEIRDAIQSGNIDEAHELLHEMEHLVDELPDVAADTDLTEQDWKEIQKASEQLSEAFGKLDESFHVEDSDPQAVYDGVAESIDSAVEQISQRIPADADVPATGNSSSEHDHGVVAARYACGPSLIYCGIGLAGSILLVAIFPYSSLTDSMAHTDPMAPLQMLLVAIPAYATPLNVMMQVGGMFVHGNSVGAAYVLLALGAGANLGQLAWAYRMYGLKQATAFLAVFVVVVTAIAYSIEDPLYSAGEVDHPHTHAFDVYACPYTGNGSDLASKAWTKIREDARMYEVAGLAGVCFLIAVGAVLRVMDPENQLDSKLASWGERQRSDTESVFHADLPGPVLGAVSLIGLVAMSVAGCYVFYPAPEDTLQDLQIVKADALTYASSGDVENAVKSIERYDDLTRKLQVGYYLRNFELSEFQQARARVLRGRLERLKDLLEAEHDFDEVRDSNWEISESHRRVREAFTPQED